jgi:uracil-DNA glycosylase
VSSNLSARESSDKARELPAPAITSLKKLVEAERRCRRCGLYKCATQVVPGEGDKNARVMVVWEQPGDQEDRAGRPFVGPAGRILDRALADAGIERAQTFVTNAVKHFKFEMRGKRRLHKRPNTYEIERCRWWLGQERALVKPEVVVAMGVTAARSVLGEVVSISRVRGQPIATSDNEQVVVTLRPSALLRIEDETERKVAYQRFVRDLRKVSTLLDR